MIRIAVVMESGINDADNRLKEISETEAGINSLEETNVLHNMRYPIMSTLLKAGLISESFCGGRGLCQRCRIQFMGSAPIPTAVERNTFSPEELRQGYRLACMAKPRNDCVVRLDFIKSKKIDIVTEAVDIKNGKTVHERTNMLCALENIGSEDVASENIGLEDVASENIGLEGVASENIELESVASENIGLEGAASENIGLEGAVSKNIGPEGAVSENIDLNGQPKCIIALDLGTTTIAMQLLGIETGKIIDSYCAMNPQRSYGADVLSRIQAASEGHAKAMKESVWKVIYDGINRFTNKAQEAHLKICCMCIAGNTTMEHLLMGLSTQNLGQSPFTPVELGLQKCTITIGISTGNTVIEETITGDTAIEKTITGNTVIEETITGDTAIEETITGDTAIENSEIRVTTTGNTTSEHKLPVYITPGISAFVGGDIAAGLYHCNLYDISAPNQQSTAIQNSAILFIDLGTNGEMAIVSGDRIIVTATAAGPAFEGGAAAAVPGSDMIKVAAFLLDKGIIDETGLMTEPYFSEGINIDAAQLVQRDILRCTQSDTPNTAASGIIRLTQTDIRSLQMAKAAIRAGIDILCSKIENCRISKVYLAGGFGYYLDVNSAVAIGLLPENLKSCTRAAGNTSLAGAFDMGKDLWSGRLTDDKLSERLSRIESINLAEEEGFDRLYLSYVNFPEK